MLFHKELGYVELGALVTDKGKEKEREGERDAITNPQSTSAENSEIAKL